MDIQLKNKLLSVLNTPATIEILKEYAEFEIGRLHKYLEQEHDFNTIKKYQGQIWELRRLISLRDRLLEEKAKDDNQRQAKSNLRPYLQRTGVSRNSIL